MSPAPTPSVLRRLLLASLPLAGTLAAAEPAPPGRPLAPRSTSAGATLFATLAPEHTGVRVENNYGDPAMWRERYREFSLGAIGTGIAIGDYDADGRPDLFVVSKIEPCRLFRNLGDLRFEDVTEKAGVAGPADAWQQGAAFADVNNDGRLDLYVCRFDAPNLLYLNQGDGTFREAAAAVGLAVRDASGMAAFADYDRDGWLDVYLQTNVLNAEARPNGQRDRLFRNQGDGTFAEVTDRAGIAGDTQGHSATWWDYDHDGWPDLYIANDFKDPDQLYRNNGNGTFTHVLSYVVPHTPHSSMGADLGDVDNDGLIDLFVADMAATTHAKDHRGMAKVRAGLTENEANPAAAPQYMRNALFLNAGTGDMLEAAFLAGLDATDWTWSVRFEDLDNDGRLDLHVTNGMIRELHNADIVRRISNLESISDRVRVWQSSPVLAEKNLAFRNAGDVRFEPAGAAWGLDHHGVSFGAAFGDLDGDGDLDLVFANYRENVTICRNDSDRGHRLLVDLRGTLSNRFGVGATVRIETAAGPQIRQLVLARGYLSTSEPMLHFGLGDDDRVERLTVEWPSGHVQSFANLPADRRYTITEPAEQPPPAGNPALRLNPTAAQPAGATPSPGSLPRAAPQFVETSRALGLMLASRERPLDELARQPLLPWRLNRLGPGVAFADLDGDGEDDLCLAGAAGERAQLAGNFGGGRFLPPATTLFGGATETADAMPLFFDANGDGTQDLLLTKGGVAAPAGSPAYQPRLFLNDGTGRFTRAPDDALPAWPESTGPACAADFDRDGRLDVFIGGRVVPGAYPTAPRSALLANRGGKFIDVTDELAPALRRIGLVNAGLWSDVDDDGWPDLLLALQWGHVTCLRNREGKGFEDATETLGFASAGTGWWSSLAAGDLNGDGRPDYVAGNTGLNTKYRATPERPTLLYAGAFDPSGRPQLVEAYHEGETLRPVRGLPQIAAAMPAIGKKFPTFESYANATLEAIFPPERLAAARRLTATELRSGIFLSQPEGGYRFEPLPRLAQIAPIYGVAIGDFDGDGRADVYAVQNSYAPIPETGRFDGGLSLLLRGDGRGGLAPVPPAASGLVVPHDAKALAVVDFDQDGWPDFFVTRNNDRTLAFRNQPPAGRASFAVALRGPAGNPTGVGARIAVRLVDGTTQAAEVAAGSGYLAQSTAAQFFGYPETNPPREVVVRWPDGRVTVQPWTTPQRKLAIAAPPP